MYYEEATSLFAHARCEKSNGVARVGESVLSVIFGPPLDLVSGPAEPNIASPAGERNVDRAEKRNHHHHHRRRRRRRQGREIPLDAACCCCYCLLQESVKGPFLHLFSRRNNILFKPVEKIAAKSLRKCRKICCYYSGLLFFAPLSMGI